MFITLDEAIALISEKRQAETERHLKNFDENPDLEVMNGRYGPYLVYKGENFRLPKSMHERAAVLTYKECMDFIQAQEDKPKAVAGKRRFARKKS